MCTYVVELDSHGHSRQATIYLQVFSLTSNDPNIIGDINLVHSSRVYSCGMLGVQGHRLPARPSALNVVAIKWFA